MNGRYLEAGAWAAVALGVAAIGRAVTLELSGVNPVIRLPPAHSEVASPYRSDSALQAVVGRDLFRADRRPAVTRYDPAGMNTGPGVPSAPVRPVLRLRGIMLTDTARALVEGFPATEGGRLVRVGESVAGLRVMAITRLQVRVGTADTSWTLTIQGHSP